MGADQKLTALSQLCILMPLFAPADSIATEQAPRPADVHTGTGESFGSCSSRLSFPPPPLSLPLSVSVSVSLRESGINPTLAVNLGLVIYVSPAVSRKCSRLQVHPSFHVADAQMINIIDKLQVARDKGIFQPLTDSFLQTSQREMRGARLTGSL
jgi:hypothetical protein